MCLQNFAKIDPTVSLLPQSHSHTKRTFLSLFLSKRTSLTSLIQPLIVRDLLIYDTVCDYFDELQSNTVALTKVSIRRALH